MSGNKPPENEAKMPRLSLRQRYQFRCGYCGVHEDDVGARLTRDHFQPRVHGGTHRIENLVYCCPACNSFKGDWWSPDPNQCLLHPKRDDLSLHLVEALDHRLVGITEQGRIHIEVLRLNRPQLIAHRARQYEEAIRQARDTLIDRRFAAMEAEIALLRRQLGERP